MRASRAAGDVPRASTAGYYFEPTLLADVDSSMTVAQDEIFGPVGVAIPFDDEDDAVRIANDTRYGLAAGIWHPDPGARVLGRTARAGRHGHDQRWRWWARTCGDRSAATSTPGSVGSSVTTACSSTPS